MLKFRIFIGSCIVLILTKQIFASSINKDSDLLNLPHMTTGLRFSETAQGKKVIMNAKFAAGQCHLNIVKKQKKLIHKIKNEPVMQKSTKLSKTEELKAFIRYESAANMGNTYATLELAHSYFYGMGCDENLEVAFKYYKIAANAGSIEAKYCQAYMYLHGAGVEKNYKKASECFDKIPNVIDECNPYGGIHLKVNRANKSDSKFDETQTYLKNTFIRIKNKAAIQGLKKTSRIEKRKAFDLFKSAANAGHIHANLKLAHAYCQGRGCEENLEAAFKYYNIAADAGLDKAKYYRAQMYYHGQGVKQDLDKALACFQELADHGDECDQYNYAQLMMIETPQSDCGFHIAHSYLKKSAANGHLDALEEIHALIMNKELQITLTADEETFFINKYDIDTNKFRHSHLIMLVAESYAQGKGTAQNPKLAFEYYNLAAMYNNIQAQVIIGDLYYNGVGIEKNYTMARKWYQLGRTHLTAESCFNLGNIYRYGWGCNKNIEEAYKLYNISAFDLYPDALYAIGELFESSKIKIDSSPLDQPDLKQALYYYVAAKEAQHPKAQFKIDALTLQELLLDLKHSSSTYFTLENTVNSSHACSL